MKKIRDTGSKKGQYLPPKLVRLGSALELTRGGNSNGGDISGQKVMC